MYMTDEEALKACEEMIASCKRGPVEEWRPGFLDAAATALREKIAAKKLKRPTLEEMEKRLRDNAEGWQSHGNHSAATNDRAAADLIKYVCEHLVGELKSIYIREYRDNLDIWAGRVLSRLGVVV